MDQAKPDLFNSQAADAGMLGILQPRPGQLPDLIQHWRGPRPLRVCSGGTTSRAAVDQGWTLDLRQHFSRVHWDEADRTVLIEGGCRMGDVLAAFDHADPEDISELLELREMPGRLATAFVREERELLLDRRFHAILECMSVELSSCIKTGSTDAVQKWKGASTAAFA